MSNKIVFSNGTEIRFENGDSIKDVEKKINNELQSLSKPPIIFEDEGHFISKEFMNKIRNRMKDKFEMSLELKTIK